MVKIGQIWRECSGELHAVIAVANTNSETDWDPTVVFKSTCDGIIRARHLELFVEEMELIYDSV